VYLSGYRLFIHSFIIEYTFVGGKSKKKTYLEIFLTKRFVVLINIYLFNIHFKNKIVY